MRLKIFRSAILQTIGDPYSQDSACCGCQNQLCVCYTASSWPQISWRFAA